MGRRSLLLQLYLQQKEFVLSLRPVPVLLGAAAGVPRAFLVLVDKDLRALEREVLPQALVIFLEVGELRDVVERGVSGFLEVPGSGLLRLFHVPEVLHPALGVQVEDEAGGCALIGVLLDVPFEVAIGVPKEDSVLFLREEFLELGVG